MAAPTESCSLVIDGHSFDFDVEGDCAWGKDEVVYHSDGVISCAPWRDSGFTVLNTFDADEQKRLVEGTTKIITSIFDDLGWQYPDDFRLENYHTVAHTTEMHGEVIRRTRFLTNAEFPIDLQVVAKKVTEAIGRKVGPINPMLGLDKNAHPAKEIVILRISRPHSLDINPPHRDGYLGIWKHTINLWVPVAGCDERSSLPIIPGSHLWNERDVYRTPAKGARINGLPYHVPAILKTKHGLEMHRPNPALGQMLVFTPFLVHGAAVNLNQNTTRFSFELRLFDEEAQTDHKAA